MRDFEKLGLFYLGRSHDLASGTTGEEPLLYDSRDLVTHAVAVGMTGSGKTGLCLSLLEEAAIDGVPAIAIDPKGDLSNLLLTFPGLTPEEFEPWVSADEARTRGLSVGEFARQQAESWQKGLAQWGQDGARIQRLRDAAEFAVYTPGSSAGLPVSILDSFAAPPAAVLDDHELLADRLQTTVTSLLTLAGIEADPTRSREHILVSTLVGQAWAEGRNLDLAGLVQAIQAPPITRVGVLDLDSFFPPGDRFELALRLNNLLATPGFQRWLEGDPLDIDRLLYTKTGKPRVAVFSIAHLGDNERMFFVSLLLNQVLSWVRAQRGTSSLRAILYMDEIFGFFPPVANPPSKLPLLTLLKQARAFGLGVVLATQNPVDLDYKGLANTGTWFLGRLQTERDKSRVLEGLEGAAAGAGEAFDRSRMDQLLAALGKRVFLMHNVHEKDPVVFQTRWALSYLRGPLGRDEIRRLMAPLKEARAAGADRAAPGRAVSAAPPSGTAAGIASAAAGAVPTSAPPPRPQPAGAAGAGTRPVLPPAIEQYFAPAAPSGGARAGRTANQPGITYTPMLYGAARIDFGDTRLGVSATRDAYILAPIADAAVPVDWQNAVESETPPASLSREPADPGAAFETLPAPAARPANYPKWTKDFTQWLSRSQQVELMRSPRLELASIPGESERDFRIRLQAAFREERDRAVEALRQKYAPKIATLTERLRRAEQAVERESEQARQQKMQTAVSVGATLLGALLGRKRVSASTLGRATTAVRGAGRTMKEMTDIQRAQETAGVLKQQLADFEAQFQADTQSIAAGFDPLQETLEPLALKPKRTGVAVQLVALVWVPSE